MSNWIEQVRALEAVEREAALERLGTRDPRCLFCSEAEPGVLVHTLDGIECYECLCLRQGRSPIELHHPAGRHNSPITVAIPANEHRLLSRLQRGWPEQTLRNSDGSPLLEMAAIIRGWLDVLYLILDRLVAKLPASLERLDDLLKAKLGDRWWESLGFKVDDD